MEHIAANEIGRMTPLSLAEVMMQKPGKTRPDSHGNISGKPTPCETCPNHECGERYPAALLTVKYKLKCGAFDKNCTGEKEYLIRADRSQAFIREEAKKILDAYAKNSVLSVSLTHQDAHISQCAKFDIYVNRGARG